MDNIVIVGGELHNKGAQAMTFTVIDEMKQRHPNKRIVLLANPYTLLDEREKEYLNFEIFPWSFRIKACIAGLPYSTYPGLIEYSKAILKGPGIPKEKLNEIRSILKNANMIIDVSGYALSSQMGFFSSLGYLYNIIIAQKYNIPMYILPQSFGPFDYNPKHKKKLIGLMKKYLTYPEKIYARENEGIEQLKPFELKNLEKSYDCVLQGRAEYTTSHLYNNEKKVEITRNINEFKNSVGIVPNQKIMEHGNEDELIEVYKELIEFILKEDKKVFLIRHSNIDLYVLLKLKEIFKDENNVVLIEKDYNCIQLNTIIKKFDFLIASRYHSIIHAYKNSVPTLVFGWAVKYQELMSLYNQEKYLFDVRGRQNKTKIMETLEYLIKNHEQETKVIREESNKIRYKNIFEQIRSS